MLTACIFVNSPFCFRNICTHLLPLKFTHDYFKMATKRMHLGGENMRNNIVTNQREKAKALCNHKSIGLFNSFN